LTIRSRHLTWLIRANPYYNPWLRNLCNP